MRVTILIFLLFNALLITAQTISFVDEENNSIENVYLEFNLDGVNKKYSSDKDGLITIDLNYPKETIFKISHISYQTISSNIFVSDTTFVLQKKSFNVDEVIVTAQIKPIFKSEAIQKVKLITRKDIDLQAANNLKELLDKEMNMRLSYDNILGSSVSIQGISGQNVKILIDGVPVIGRLNGNIDLSQINLNNINRVEIIEGPLSVDFGTDALAGTINLITDKKIDDKFSSSYNLFYESVGNYNADLSLSYNISKHSFYFDFGRKYFDGWSKNEEFSLFPKSQIADTNRFKSWNPKEQYFGRLQYKLKQKNHDIRLFYDSYYEKITNLGYPRLPYYETAFDDYYYTRRNNLGLDVKFNFSDKENFNFLSSFNHYNRRKNTYFNDLTTLDQILTDNDSDQDTSVFNLLMNKLVFSSYKSEKIQYQLGFDSKIEYATGERINKDERTLGDHAIFLSTKWSPLNYFSLKPALRLSYNSKFEVPVIPSLNMILKKNQYSLRFSYAKGFRSPSLKELFFEFVDINHNIIGNRNLEPENSDNFQINLDYEERFKDYKVELGTRLFYNDISNLITLAQSPSSSEYTYFNLGLYKTKGISANLNLSTEKLNFSLSAGNIGRYNDLSEESNVVKYSYSTSCNSSINYTFKKYYTTASIYFNYVGKLPVFYKDNNEEIIESEIESYQIFDFVLKKSFSSGKINLSFGVKNLFDVQDIFSFSSSDAHSSSSNRQSIAYGRTFFTSLNFRL